MHFYRIVHTVDGLEVPQRFEVKQADAHAFAKTKFSPILRPELRIELVDISTTADRVCKLLNGDTDGLPILKTWKLTDRGGLVDCANGE